MINNPIIQKSLENSGSFVFWHRLSIEKQDLEIADKYGIPIEIDVSHNPDTGKSYIGHPETSYKHLPFVSKNNISIEFLETFVNGHSDIFIVFDCKDDKALPDIEKFINNTDKNRIILISFVKEWSNGRFSNEYIGIDKIERFRSRNDVFWIGNAVVNNWKEASDVLDKIKISQRDTVDGLSFFLPYYLIPFPKMKTYKDVFEAGYLPVFASDLIFKKPEFNYIGATALSFNATKIGSFSKSFLKT